MKTNRIPTELVSKAIEETSALSDLQLGKLSISFRSAMGPSATSEMVFGFATGILVMQKPLRLAALSTFDPKFFTPEEVEKKIEAQIEEWCRA